MFITIVAYHPSVTATKAQLAPRSVPDSFFRARPTAAFVTGGQRFEIVVSQTTTPFKRVGWSLLLGGVVARARGTPRRAYRLDALETAIRLASTVS